MANPFHLMTFADEDRVREVCMMLVSMLAIGLEVLSEHNLFSGPTPMIQNPGVLCLILMDVLTRGTLSFNINDVVEEIETWAIKVGIDLEFKEEWESHFEYIDSEDLGQILCLEMDWKAWVRDFCSIKKGMKVKLT